MKEFDFLTEHAYFTSKQHNEYIGTFYHYARMENDELIETGTIVIPNVKEANYKEPAFSFVQNKEAVVRENFPEWFSSLINPVWKKYDQVTRLRKLTKQ